MANLLIILICFLITTKAKQLMSEEDAIKFIASANAKTEQKMTRGTLADWAYDSNITQANLNHSLAMAAENAEDAKEMWRQVNEFNWRGFSNQSLRRQFEYYASIGNLALPEPKYKLLMNIIENMTAVYSTAKICDYKNSSNCNLALDPELTKIMATSEDEKELRHVWVKWRDSVGPKVKEHYIKYVELSNEAAKLNDFEDMGESWLSNFDNPKIKHQVKALWKQVRPLYVQLHAYIRYKLKQKYGDVVSEKGPIPAHLLGNMWAQNWNALAVETQPFPEVVAVNFTAELIKQNYTPIKIFKTAEQFYTSINMSAMPESFWTKSILEKPADREMICHATSWDFYDQKDFRISQCTEVTLEHVSIAHHEMGHVEYFIQYKDQPITFRDGANEGFHEAVGDSIALSFGSAKHLHKIGLIKTKDLDPKIILNNLLRVGLSKIVTLPFAYLLDLYRWRVFSGKITPDNYNCKWWKLVRKYQGLEQPVDRSEEDFDAAAKFHFVADISYLRYFVSLVIQFQFHKAMCEKAGQYEPDNPEKPLHECDIYEKTKAGNALKKMLAMGSSMPWPDAMETLTGQRNMDASSLLEYFKPLQDWLEEENKKNGAYIGWKKSKKSCVKTRQELESKRKN